MLRAYRVIKGILAFLLIAGTAIILSLETPRPGTTPVKNYEIVRDFLFYDPYNHTILSRVERLKQETAAVFSGTWEVLSNLVHSKEFIEEIFIYQVSTKMEQMDSLLDGYFGDDTNFRDFIIVDSGNRVLYKKAAGAFSPEYADIGDHYRVRTTPDALVFQVMYRDENFDIDLQIYCLYSHDLVLRKLRESGFPSYLMADGRIIRNTPAMPPHIGAAMLVTSNRHLAFSGLDIFEIQPLLSDGTMIASVGIVYPARSFASILLSVAKIAAVLFLVLVIFILDRVISKRLAGNAAGHKRVSKKTADAARDEEDGEKHLEWIENYIQGTEEKKK